MWGGLDTWSDVARNGRNVLPLLATGALLAAVTACSSGPSRPRMLSASIGGNAVTFLKPVKTRASGTVLANGTGYTLYWFSKDTPAWSYCADTCLPQWPPATGTPEVEPGDTLAGRLGTIRRSGGVVQATYDGHPLYTFAGDFDPGDVGGNNVVQFGGTWHAVRPG
jgi:predicted lipoprotein with Yx(FWY)xxD motif